jgi:hemoglobin
MCNEEHSGGVARAGAASAVSGAGRPRREGEDMPMPSCPHSLYRQLGGYEPIAALVDLFYRRAVADAELAPFFAHLDMERLRRHQATFLAAALGGPVAYKGATLRRAHAGLGITARHFQRVAAHLAAALHACRVPEPLVEAVMAQVAALQDDVVSPKTDGDTSQ